LLVSEPEGPPFAPVRPVPANAVSNEITQSELGSEQKTSFAREVSPDFSYRP
jgi:hypothetical protein